MASGNVAPVIDNLDDLPDALKEQLSKSFLKGSGSLDGWIEKLKPILKNGPRNLDEIILAWYAEYDSEILVRSTTTMKLKKAVLGGLLIQPSKAVYAFPDKKEST